MLNLPPLRSEDIRQRRLILRPFQIQAKEILFLKETLNGLMADHTGQPLDKISEDTDRDYFLSPAEAGQYGLIDRVVDSSGDGGIITEG